MRIKTIDEHIKAGWVSVLVETAADVEMFNSDEFQEKIDDAFAQKDYNPPRYDDDWKTPWLEVVNGRDGAMHVAYREDGVGETDRALLPAEVSVWSYDRCTISLNPVQSEKAVE